MSTFAQRELDGIFLVGFSPAIVAFIQLEPTGKLIHTPPSKRGKDTRYMRLSEPVSNRSERAFPDIRSPVAYCIVQLREPPIRDGQSRQKNEIDQRVDMALLGEITG